jgi:glycosyltransferase involved in cell wall biosynthesis
MNRPRVSIICLCYNHRQFLVEAMESVMAQTYTNLQIIVVDDCSTDGSGEVIQDLGRKYPQLEVMLLPSNLGNCKAFNAAWQRADGDLVIDFATDDVMIPVRVERQVEFFLTQEPHVGVVFTDATYIDATGREFKNHFEFLFRKKLIHRVPVGDVFRDVLRTYFVCSPTMMIRSEVLRELGGYDENLAYEDFDFWVRASRKFHFAFLHERLTLVRRSSGSMSSGWYKPGDPQLYSTYLICGKAIVLCRDEGDRQAVRERIIYEFRQSVFSENRTEAKLFFELLQTLGEIPFSVSVVQLLSKLPLPWSWLRKSYYALFYS